MTPAAHARVMRNHAKYRARWREQGRCSECGATRKPPTTMCEMCLIANVIRVERCVYKKRMARASLEVKR